MTQIPPQDPVLQIPDPISSVQGQGLELEGSAGQKALDSLPVRKHWFCPFPYKVGTPHCRFVTVSRWMKERSRSFMSLFVEG